MCRAWVTCILIVLLFASRALYNVSAIVLKRIPNFEYGWNYITDQVSNDFGFL